MKFPLQTGAAAAAAAAALLLEAAGALPADAGPASLQMATSIMARRQGLMTGGGGASEALQAGFAQKALAAAVRQHPGDDRAAALRGYVRDSAASAAPFLSNATRDALAYPLDRLSNGNALLALAAAAPETNDTPRFRAAAEALRESIDLNRRSSEGGLWYYVYPNWSYLDGMYSLAPFYTLYTTTAGAGGGDADAIRTLDDVSHQLGLLWTHTRNASTGLLVHGYDDSRTAAWADPATGASPHVWGRSLGWFAMALVDTLELLPPSACRVRDSLLAMYRDLAAALVAAVDPPTGGWWQVLDRPGAAKNYIESSGTAMFTYALLKGARLGYLADAGVAAAASSVGARAQKYLSDTFVVRNANGTLGYNGTVAVCSLNSSASYEYYVGQPILYNSVLGSAAYVLASLEVERLGEK